MATTEGAPATPEKSPTKRPTSKALSMKHIYQATPKHGGWLRAEAIPRSMLMCGRTLDLTDVRRPASEVEDTIGRLYAEAETKKEARNQPPPDRFPQGGITFEFEAAENRYKTIRKPAKRITKDEMTEVLINQNSIGLTKKKECMQKLYEKYVPNLKISVDDLDPLPTRKT
mmetsp:Transcript_15983/g.34706  ORF Transcript_15983/g.34706 Transcript_15983/m.34706 type:complete len:171 (+) Transcript_15983:128-640(+)